MHWGKAIYMALKSRRMTQVGLGEKINISQSTISSMMHGRHEPTMSLYIRIMNGIGYDVCIVEKNKSKVMCQLEDDFVRPTAMQRGGKQKWKNEKSKKEKIEKGLDSCEYTD